MLHDTLLVARMDVPPPPPVEEADSPATRIARTEAILAASAVRCTQARQQYAAVRQQCAAISLHLARLHALRVPPPPGVVRRTSLKDCLMPAPTIMVIDHEPVLRALFNEILTEAGYQVDLYPYGSPARAELQRARPALIVLDYRPGDEPVVERLLRTRPQGPAGPIPVLLCSTEAAALAADPRWSQPCAIAICPKPFNLDDLLGIVATQLAQGAE